MVIKLYLQVKIYDGSPRSPELPFPEESVQGLSFHPGELAGKHKTIQENDRTERRRRV
jgi:hypothetical protein